MTWKVISVEAVNFRSLGSIRWDLSSQPGITLIYGRKKNTRRSNGSGKSSLFGAIEFALWGWIPERTSADKVIRRGTDSAKVTVVIESGGKLYTIERQRTKRGPSLTVSGFDDRGIVEGTQRAIESLVGDLLTFQQTRMFSGAASSFCRLTDGGRKALLEKMLRLDCYQRAREIAAEELQAEKRKAENLESLALSAERNLDAARERRQRAAYTSAVRPLRIYRKFYTLRDAVFTLADEADDAYRLLGRSLMEEATRKEEARKERKRLEAEIDRLEVQVEDQEKAIKPTTDKIATLSAQIAEIRRQLNQIKSDRHPDICPTCGQRWASDCDPQAIADAVKLSNDRILSLERERAPLERQVSEAQDGVEDLKRHLRSTRQSLSGQDESGRESRLISGLRSAAINAEVDLQTAIQRLEDFCAENDPEAYDEAEMASVEAEVEEAKAEVAGVSQQQADVNRRIESFKFWVKGFGPAGIPSYLMDSSVPALNEVAAKIANDLSDGEMTVSFNAAEAKGSGSVFKVDVEFTDGGGSFEEASRGEQTRADLAVLLAIAELATERTDTACEQLFFDEVMDGADEHFAEAFVSMLRNHYKGRQCWVISHDPGIGNVCDRTMRVVKTGGVTSIAGSE